MACGNNMVSRDGLQSAPTSPAVPSRPAVTLQDPSPQQIQVAKEGVRNAIASAERASASARTSSDIARAAKDAQRALDSAQRLRGVDANTRRSLVRDAEKQLAKVKEASARVESGSRAEASHQERLAREAMSVPRLSQMTLGVPAFRAAPADVLDAPQSETPRERSDTRRDAHIDMRAELASLREGTGRNKDLGDFSEAVVSGLAVLSGQSILQQHNPGDGPHGIDIQTVDGSGKVWAFEVKGTATDGKVPLGDRYDVGRQGSASYVSDRSQNAHVSADAAAGVGPDSDQMGSLLVQVNVATGEVGVWELDSEGRRAGATRAERGAPLEMWSLDAIVSAVEGS